MCVWRCRTGRKSQKAARIIDLSFAFLPLNSLYSSLQVGGNLAVRRDQRCGVYDPRIEGLWLTVGVSARGSKMINVIHRALLSVPCKCGQGTDAAPSREAMSISGTRLPLHSCYECPPP